MTGICVALSSLLALAMAANGLFMLGDPNAWYFTVPGVTTTGPFNQHFVRDIGMIYVFTGVALALGAARPRWRAALWAGAAVWLSGHALFHFWEVAVGICGVSALSRDFPGVTVPALLAVALAVWAYRDARWRSG